MPSDGPVADTVTNTESDILSFRWTQSTLDSHHLLLLPRDRQQIARIDRGHVHFIVSTLQQDGEGLQHE